MFLWLRAGKRDWGAALAWYLHVGLRGVRQGNAQVSDFLKRIKGMGQTLEMRSWCFCPPPPQKMLPESK